MRHCELKDTLQALYHPHNSETIMYSQIMFQTCHVEPYEQSFPNMYNTWGPTYEKISSNLFEGVKNMFFSCFSFHYLLIGHFAGFLKVFEFLNLGFILSNVKVCYLASKWAIRKSSEKIFHRLAFMYYTFMHG